ncbi:hypothetical protein BH11MYX2_BH11MYX2_27330 [soil metagenome]
MKRLSLIAVVFASSACTTNNPKAHLPSTTYDDLPQPFPLGIHAQTPPQMTEPPAPPAKHDAVARMDFNRIAVRLNLPYYWIADINNDKNLDANELATLLFYPKASPSFEAAYEMIVKAKDAPGDLLTDDGKRRQLVIKDLDQGRPTLVLTDLSKLSPSEVHFTRTMLAIADEIDKTYDVMNGAAGQATLLPPDPESRSLFRRNRGAKCVGPATENDPTCSAIPGSPKAVFGIYPADLQAKNGFCKTIETSADKALRDPFTVVRGSADKLTAVPYTEAYKESFHTISTMLRAATKDLDAKTETPLITYLNAAATSFETNEWGPADEAWAKMTVDNSKWYVRVAPDEVYWEPCSFKAGLHLTFALINQGSRKWQEKLMPFQQEMETSVSKLAGPPYKTHPVTFHLPDFIEIVINAGDDRSAIGGTIGQSLPNFGAVANEGRGRTIAMVNLNTDPDSTDARRSQAMSMLDAPSMQSYSGSQEAGQLPTILHEVTHNLGPSHEYKVKGKTAGEIFGGPMGSMMEELKAQTGALYLLELLRTKKLISDELAAQAYADSIVWAMGHISLGMYDGTGNRKTYGNVAAIQIGMLIERGALVWDAKAPASNGTDTGAMHINAAKLVPAVNDMMKTIAGIKARGDKKAADALAKKFVDSDKIVPHKIIQERFRRQPKGSYVYAFVL